ncbi:hypothetical protein NKG94_20205 [Micromonospora sp. M12]
MVTSPHHGAGLAGPIRTGDRVQVLDERVLITGRLDSDEINVGGSKVSAGVVRGVLAGHPAVAWARVTGRRAPVLGRMVVADVVLAPADASSADPGVPDEAALVRWCADRLPEYAVPRRIRVLTDIPVKGDPEERCLTRRHPARPAQLRRPRLRRLPGLGLAIVTDLLDAGVRVAAFARTITRS